MPQPELQKKRNDEGGVPRLVPSLDPSLELAWRKRQHQRAEQKATPINLDLPSGLQVTAYRAPLRWMVKKGLIPDPFTAVVKEHIAALEGGNAEDVARQVADDFNEDAELSFKRLMDVFYGVWIGLVLSPSFTDDEEREGSEEPPYWVGDVDYFDLVYLYQWAQGVDQSAVDFLREQAETMGNVADGEGVPLSAEPVLRVERRGGRLVGLVDRPSDMGMGQLHRAEDGGDEGSSVPQEAEENPVRAKVQRGADQPDDLRRPRRRTTRRSA